ncbi:hypothetical protein [Streptomyces clavuligerus]|uniref:hypothetical protein n=1 Tax=Streptomyces clavuligerus TaxID=1901 RepID=UPI0001851FBB|nr:hypothetical protein [Streptomyces clavuligerus]WDN56035.1 hypothetical protein LL058_29565 [Streptomyces clavuligerus]
MRAAGRVLARLARRDAAAWADRAFDRFTGAGFTVLALMPPACDTRDRVFRERAARAFGDLADGPAAGRAPVVCCRAASWAWQTVIETAPGMCAADDELRVLGVTMPDCEAEADYRPPYFEEELWELLAEDAQYSVPRGPRPHRRRGGK